MRRPRWSEEAARVKSKYPVSVLVLAPPSASTLSREGLGRLLVLPTLPDLRRGISTLRTRVLLLVERPLATPDAESVRLGVLFSECLGSFRLTNERSE